MRKGDKAGRNNKNILRVGVWQGGLREKIFVDKLRPSHRYQADKNW